jgi:aminoglycoside phosphotransferase (APT) family kinase protein
MSERADDHVDVGEEVPVLDHLSGSPLDLHAEAVTHVDDLAAVPDEAHFKIPPTPDENLREIRRIVEGLAVAVAKLDERVEDIHKRVESLRDRTRTWDGQPLWIHIRKIEAMLTEHTKPGLFG